MASSAFRNRRAENLTHNNGMRRQYPVFDQQSGKMFSWAVLLLPFLEETSLYSQFDKSKSILDQVNEPQQQWCHVSCAPPMPLSAASIPSNQHRQRSASPRATTRPTFRQFIRICSCFIRAR